MEESVGPFLKERKLSNR